MKYESPGYFEIKQFEVFNYEKTKSVDLTNIASTIQINESIFTDTIIVKATIIDTADVIGTFPIVGEEYATLVLEDIFGIELKHDLFLYASTDGEYDTESDTRTSYTLFFCSEEKFEASRIMLEQATSAETVSDTVATLYRNNIKRKVQQCDLLVIESVTNRTNYVIPRLDLFQAFQFLANKAYNDQSIDSNYLFFQTRRNFWFTPISYLNKIATKRPFNKKGNNRSVLYNNSGELLSPYLDYTYTSSNIDFTSKSYQEKYFNFFELNVFSRFDTLDALKGQFKIGVDAISPQLGSLVGRNVNIESNSDVFDFKKQSLLRRGSIIDKHTDKFYQDTFRDDNHYIYSILDNYSRQAGVVGIGDDSKFYSELIKRRTTFMKNLLEVTLNGKCYGHNAIFAGSIIYLDLNKFQAPNRKSVYQKDPFISGDYIVTSIQHTYRIGEAHTMALEINKMPYIDYTADDFDGERRKRLQELDYNVNSLLGRNIL